MTYSEQQFVPLNRQLFRRSLAEALTDLLSQKYRTAKQLAREVGIDPTTAENIRKGHLSIPTLQKVIAAEGRELWERLGDELFGETFFEHEERKLQSIIKEAEDAHSNLIRLRARRAELLPGSKSLDGNSPGEGADTGRGAESRTWAAADREGQAPIAGRRPEAAD